MVQRGKRSFGGKEIREELDYAVQRTMVKMMTTRQRGDEGKDSAERTMAPAEGMSDRMKWINN